METPKQGMPEERPDVDENSKQKDLDAVREDPQREFLTTNLGVRVDDTDNSLTAGERGPTLLEDFHFREKLTHFDHERIPERVVHARGSGAHGYFQVNEPMTEYTRAAFLQDPSVKTPVFVRFSTVVGFRGSADTVRDVRGFATKFYTSEGNYDLVGNNIPVFFIQDAMKFPDLVHSIKPEQHNQMPQASAAHDTFWDFVANLPEITHMMMWLLSDRALPRSYRMMDGFSVNTFRFVNAQGVGRFIKLHWRPVLGVHSLVWDETQKIAGKDPDFNRRDLWEAIEMGQYPEFELGAQMIEQADELKFDFDVLDPTKIWPEEDVPIKWFGKMTLNRNPDNFFAETEQVAFCPANVVPGIDFSNDPLLQGRLFSYLDTQLIRLGGPNFHEIPINRPLAPVANNQREGYHRTTINKGPTGYLPNTVGDGKPHPASPEQGGFQHYMEKVEGHKIRKRSPSFSDHFSQARLFWNSMSEAEKRHIIRALHFEVGKVMSKDIRRQVVELFSHVDRELAEEVAMGVGVTDAKLAEPSTVTKASPALSQERTVKDTIRTRRVAILLAEGYDHAQLMAVQKALTDGGASTTIIARYQGMLAGSDGEQVEVAKNYETTASVLFDALYIPGGAPCVETLKTQGDAVHFVNEMFRHCKPIGATGEGVELLAASSIKGVKLSEMGDAMPVSDEGVVTLRKGEGMDAFVKAYIPAIAQHRHWNREMKMEVPA